MLARPVLDRVHWVGAQDPDRTVFDALIPLPHGTTYNAWYVQGSERAALIDSVEPRFGEQLMERLEGLGADPEILVSNHAEQDHSGMLPALVERFPRATVLCTPKAAAMLPDLLGLDPARIRTVADGEEVSLGDRSLRFLHAPWVHWPETMLTYMPEQGVLFPCDLFGSHFASNTAWASQAVGVLREAKRYYATIMMPFTKPIGKHLDRLDALDIRTICPSHGPSWDEPRVIMDAYRDWTSGPMRDRVVIAYVSMHESTRKMALHLEDRLFANGTAVDVFDLEKVDLGMVAAAAVDAATVLIGTPTVLGGAHPLAVSAAYLIGLLKPRTRWIGLFGSHGWAGRAIPHLEKLLENVRCERLDPVGIQGFPREGALAAMDGLAEQIIARHATLTPQG
ncbi:MAG: FprA family A-type flavoprotein [Pseudomonadota bacterium]